MRTPFTGLWRHPEFLKLWVGETISLAGSHVSGLALPMLAVVTLAATPLEMGILGAIRSLPVLIFGLLAGVWVDRASRRALLVGANLGRAVLVGLVAVLALLGLLRIEHLWTAAFLAGCLAVLFDVAFQAFLPAVVRRSDLVEANAKLEVGGSTVEIVAPGLAGALIQLVTAPLALVVDAASFLVSAALTWRVRIAEGTTGVLRSRAGFCHELVEGLRAVRESPILWPVAVCTTIWAGFRGAIVVLYLPFILTDLAMSPIAVGTVFSAGGLGAVALAALARRRSVRIESGRTLIAASATGTLAHLLAPLAPESRPLLSAGLLIAAQALGGAAFIVFSVGERSIRQSLVPDHLLGRVSATFRVISLGAVPVGALLGGLLGELIGLRTTLLLAGIGSLLAPAWLIGRSAVRAHRDRSGQERR